MAEPCYLEADGLLECMQEKVAEKIVCRCCLNKCEMNELIETKVIESGRKESIVDKLNCLFITKFPSIDGLPTKICRQCVDKMTIAYDFLNLCKNAENIILSCLQSKKYDANVKFNDTSKEISTQTDESVACYAGSNSRNKARDSKFGSGTEENDEEYEMMKQELSKNSVQCVKLQYNTGEQIEAFQCSKCTENFDDSEALMTHQKTRHLKSEAHVCRICRKTFRSYPRFIIHMESRAHDRTKDKSKRVSPADKVGSYIASDDVKYSCEFCERSYDSWSEFALHGEVHRVRNVVKRMVDGSLEEGVCAVCLKDCDGLVSVYRSLEFHGMIRQLNGTFSISKLLFTIFEKQYSSHPITSICESCIKNLIDAYILHGQFRYSKKVLRICTEILHKHVIFNNVENTKNSSADLNCYKELINLDVDSILSDSISFINDITKFADVSETEIQKEEKTIEESSEEHSGELNNDSYEVPIELGESMENFNNSSFEEAESMRFSPANIFEKSICNDSKYSENIYHGNNTFGSIAVEVSVEETNNSDNEGQNKCDLNFINETRPKDNNRYTSISDVKVTVSTDTIDANERANNDEIIEVKKYINPYNPLMEMKIKTIFKCTMCVENFRNEDDLKLHLTDHPKGTSHICRQCGNVYKNVDGLKAHIKNVHNRVEITCVNCGKSINKSYYRKHSSRCGQTRNLPCPDCEKKFKSSDCLRIHRKRMHCETKEGIYICDECGKIFSDTSNMLQHKRNLHVIKECHICCKHVLGERSWKAHLTTHSSAKIKVKRKAKRKNNIVYVCNQCPSSFKSSMGLMTHTNRDHLKIKPYICKICFKGFYSPYILRGHVLTHTNTKPEECLVCQGRFVDKRSLTLHMRRHTGERPFPCSQCEMSFISNYRLQAHVQRKHLGIKKEECPLCNKKFCYKSNLRVHIEQVHKKKASKENQKQDTLESPNGKFMEPNLLEVVPMPVLPPIHATKVELSGANILEVMPMGGLPPAQSISVPQMQHQMLPNQQHIIITTVQHEHYQQSHGW